MRILPTKVKQTIIERLESAGFKDGWEIKIQHIINFLMLEHNNSEQLFDEFWKFTSGYDQIRNQNYANTFKEFYEVINE